MFKKTLLKFNPQRETFVALAIFIIGIPYLYNDYSLCKVEITGFKRYRGPETGYCENYLSISSLFLRFHIILFITGY
jgi:hypothetical protein